MTPPSPPSDLPLVALRYAAGELAVPELAEFERRLATDLDVQLSVVQAVQIAAALQSSSPTSPVVARHFSGRPAAESRRRSRWLAVLSCGAVAAAMLIALRGEPLPDAERGSLAANASRGAMVSGWTAVELEHNDLLSGDDAALLVLDDEASGEDVVPDWLLAAVELGDAPPVADDADAASADSIDEET